MIVYEIIDRSIHKPVRLVLADRIRVHDNGTIRAVWFFLHEEIVSIVTNEYDFAECDRWLEQLDKEAASWSGTA